jgi:cholesterol oxidase
VDEPWDFVIIGSGFGGSVSALRLAEKGYRVLVLEKGRRFKPGDFPKSNWNLRKWMWRPALGMRGIFKMTFLRHVTVLSGVGVGGGSLVYANTLPKPKDDFFKASSWGHLADWKAELDPHYQTARKMLGAARNPYITEPDKVFAEIARELGRPEAHGPTDVSVYFGEPGVTAKDPYFGGEGPDRTGCIQCGGCMIGCRHDAKNTLDKNYLWLAEKKGVQVEADCEVSWVRPHDDGGYEVFARQGLRRKQKRRFRAHQVIFAGGVMGTVDLLLKLREESWGLPKLSERVGDFVRTNSEVLMGIVSRKKDVDFSKGIAIGSILHTSENSHCEPVRYPSGSGFFRLMGTPHAPGNNVFERLGRAFWYFLRHPLATFKSWVVPNWAKATIILLYMKTMEGHLRFVRGRGLRTMGRRGLLSEATGGVAPTASIPEATEIGMRIAEKVDGFPSSMITETVFGTPTTAHILGGACMGENAWEGVIDHQHRVFNYPGLYVVDGSAVSANPGVNPSLTICALAERAMSFVPAKQVAADPVDAGWDDAAA